jgi:hypothetical protein
MCMWRMKIYDETKRRGDAYRANMVMKLDGLDIQRPYSFMRRDAAAYRLLSPAEGRHRVRGDGGSSSFPFGPLLSSSWKGTSGNMKSSKGP